MVTQSQPPVVLLTRPLDQSRRFAGELSAALGSVHVVISPLMVPEYLTPALPDRRFSAVIFASEAGVAAMAQHPARAGLPTAAFCIGQRTAAAAIAAGFRPQSVAADAAALIFNLRDMPPTPPLLFLRGQDSTGDIAETLASSGIETLSAVVYRQVAQPLSDQAAALLLGDAPVILPVFSPRSARLLASEAVRLGLCAPVAVAALSPAVAEAAAALRPRALQIAAHPDSAAMVRAVAALIAADHAP